MKQKRLFYSIFATLFLIVFLSACNNNSTSSQTEAPAPKFDEAKYLGLWATEDIDWINGGTILEITTNNGNMLFKFTKYTEAPYLETASFSYTIHSSAISNNKVYASFADDGWTNAGNVTITLDEKQITCDFTDVGFTGEFEPEGGGFSNGTYILKKNDNAYKAVEYTDEDLYELYPEWDPDYEEDFEEDYTPSGTIASYADIDKIKNDLTASGANVFTLDFEATALKFKTAEILLRNTTANMTRYISLPPCKTTIILCMLNIHFITAITMLAAGFCKATD